MDVVALISWGATGLGGLAMLALWLRGGGLRLQRTGGTRFGTGLVFAHAGWAVVGLLLWLAYVVSGADTFGWVAWLLLPVVATLGLLLFLKWLGGRGADSDAPEQRFPVVVVAAHGLAAATTFVLVLVALLA
jgi:hypothetical protein